MFDIDHRITIAEGVSDNIPKQHFLPRNLVLEERKHSTIDVNDAPQYESTYSVKRCEGIKISRSARVLNNGKLANFSTGADWKITVQTAHLNKDGDLNEDGVWKFNLDEKENTVKVIFSSDLSFCIVIVFNIQNNIFSKIKTKLKLSIVSFSEPTDEDYNKSYLHKDLCTVNYKEPSDYRGVCFSARNNNLAVMTYQSDDKTSLDIFNVKLQHHEKQKVYYIQKLKSVRLSVPKNHDTTLIFNQLADKIIIFNSYLQYIYVYEIENDYDDQCEKFEGSSPNIIYDSTLKSEFLFTFKSISKSKVQDIDVYQITKIQNSERRNLSSAYNLFTSLKLCDLIDKEISCNSDMLFVHSYLETLMFIGDYKKLYIFHPFKRQLICTLSTGFFQIKRIMPVTWSGKEASFVYINDSQKYTLKVFSIEESAKDLSLQYLSRMAVLKTYSVNMLQKIDIGKALLNILGSYET